MNLNWFNKLSFFNPKWQFFGDVNSPDTLYNSYIKDKAKLDVALSNFALLKVITLQCDLFSMSKPYLYDKEGNEIEKDPLLDLLKNPNYFQDYSEFMWTTMFWQMLGNGYIYINHDHLRLTASNERVTSMYPLENYRLEMPGDLYDYPSLIETKRTYDILMDKSAKYIEIDDSVKKIPLRNLISIKDISTGANHFRGQSRLDALCKVVSNIEHALDSKNINIRYSGKFMVSGKQDPNNVNTLPLTNDEKIDIEQKIDDRKPVHANKSMIDIKHFVDSVKNVGLDESTMSDFLLVGSVFGVPKDVLEAFGSSTYENQEKARGGYVDYVLEPKADKLANSLIKFFGYEAEGKKLFFSWDHCSFMQVFEKEREEFKKLKIENMRSMLDLGFSIDEINSFLDSNFSQPNTKI